MDLDSGYLTLTNEVELSKLLANFNSDVVFDTIGFKIDTRNTCNFLYTEPNIVKAFRMNFIDLRNRFPGDVNNINEVEDNVYECIIDTIAENSLLCINKEMLNQNKLFVASTLYDVFVSNYIRSLIQFFGEFIIAEKNALYEACQLDNYKKNKDGTTIYGKKSYKDQKFAIINANIDRVVSFMETIDIPLEKILQVVVGSKPIVAGLSNIVMEREGGVFKQLYFNTIRDKAVESLILSSIRLYIQNKIELEGDM